MGRINLDEINSHSIFITAAGDPGKLLASVMILLISQDGECPVQLFGEHHFRKLVRQGHFRQGDELVAPFVDAFIEAIGSPYCKTETSHIGCHFFADENGKFFGSKSFAMFIEQYKIIFGINMPQ